MKVAIVHDWLTKPGGAEKVLEVLLDMFPAADLFTVVDFLEPEARGFLKGRAVRTSFIQKLPFARKRYRNYIFLMPLAVEQFDFAGYDLVVSSSYAVAKGIITGPNQVHVSYVHSPMRYAWDQQHVYLRESGLHRGLKSMLARSMLHYLRLWDFRTAQSPDAIVVNSKYIARRVKKIYGRDPEIVYPPIELDRFRPMEPKEDYYITASRFVPYKKIPLIVEAFSKMPGRRLVVIGEGPDDERARKLAGPNVSFVGYLATEEMVRQIAHARAFVFAAEEDFGIVALESQACGTPVIAFGRGGSLETVVGLDGARPTGVHFAEQSVDSICGAVDLFEQNLDRFTVSACVDNARRFSRETFVAKMRAVIDRALRAH